MEMVPGTLNIHMQDGAWIMSRDVDCNVLPHCFSALRISSLGMNGLFSMSPFSHFPENALKAFRMHAMLKVDTELGGGERGCPPPAYAPPHGSPPVRSVLNGRSSEHTSG